MGRHRVLTRHELPVSACHRRIVDCDDPCNAQVQTPAEIARAGLDRHRRPRSMRERQVANRWSSPRLRVAHAAIRDHWQRHLGTHRSALGRYRLRPWRQYTLLLEGLPAKAMSLRNGQGILIGENVDLDIYTSCERRTLADERSRDGDYVLLG